MFNLFQHCITPGSDCGKDAAVKKEKPINSNVDDATTDDDDNSSMAASEATTTIEDLLSVANKANKAAAFVGVEADSDDESLYEV